MTEPLPPLYALRAFEVAARSGSFTRAAEALSLTPSAISRHVRTLEGLFGCRLFERNGPHLALTDAGQRLARELKVGFRIIEDACLPLRSQDGQLRLKAPSTLTMRWLLRALDSLKSRSPELAVQLVSVWMDVDSVDFYAEPYDCAILLGNGHFGPGVEACKLFDEWLVPICAPEPEGSPAWDLQRLQDAELIHPSADRRDWRRWLRPQGLADEVRLDRGKVFDTLDQAISAAMGGHGLSIGDLHLVAQAVRDGQISLPFDSAVATGDSYYLVWLREHPRPQRIHQLREFLLGDVPTVDGLTVRLLNPGP
ncbi:LysR substrate-binding domain-containing protein [Pseudomonas sp. MAFF 302046]|uniref:LysR substrate-binding domain-containing protein n=1 Tax=Pseudomonas morbosilactucae TaxID=2938197 RepID=A0ABT0JGS7_9PSED|nr:LysR substrate-binding domain-containing protein [Pseudomonas morbosilactucae]MCK9815099.1 LysR substrate-binding domain-containing protein [Pseudomonas morbosilactucae]